MRYTKNPANPIHPTQPNPTQPNPTHSDKYTHAFHANVWYYLSVIFDTVGGNTCWCIWNGVQSLFIFRFWTVIMTTSRMILRMEIDCEEVDFPGIFTYLYDSNGRYLSTTFNETVRNYTFNEELDLRAVNCNLTPNQAEDLNEVS